MVIFDWKTAAIGPIRPRAPRRSPLKCTYIGLEQEIMAVNIRPPQPTVAAPLSDSAQGFRDFVRARVDGYCSEEHYNFLVTHAVSEYAFDLMRAHITLDLELERLFVANEKKLVTELYDALHRFTANDKKLDKKEESDAIQLVCRARSGFRYGLNHDLAQNVVNNFCRSNGVKKKTGLFSWAIP